MQKRIRNFLIMLTIGQILIFTSESQAMSLLQFSPPTEIKLEMFALTSDGAKDTLTYDDPACSQADLPDDNQETRFTYGCTFYDGTYEESETGVGDGLKKIYPFNNSTITIGYESHTVNGVEQGYLPSFLRKWPKAVPCPRTPPRLLPHEHIPTIAPTGAQKQSTTQPKIITSTSPTATMDWGKVMAQQKKPGVEIK